MVRSRVRLSGHASSSASEATRARFDRSAEFARVCPGGAEVQRVACWSVSQHRITVAGGVGLRVRRARTWRRRRRRSATRNARADGKRRQGAFRVGLLSGMSAGAAVQCCMFPLNTIKTRLQARPAGAGSILAQRRTIFRGLYRGFFVDTFGSIPGTGVFMATYEVLKASGAVAPGVAAPCAAFAGSLLTAPCDAIKQRMRVNPAPHRPRELTAALLLAFPDQSPLRWIPPVPHARLTLRHHPDHRLRDAQALALPNCGTRSSKDVARARRVGRRGWRAGGPRYHPARHGAHRGSVRHQHWAKM